MRHFRATACRSRALWATAFLGLWSCLLAAAMSPGAALAACPNEAFRGGSSATLPDCRAYELITPADANGRLLNTIEPQLPFNLFPTELATPAGDSVLFMIKGRPLPEPDNPNGTSDLYEARRTTAGWKATRLLTPSGDEAPLPNPGGVSVDHAYTFIQAPAGQPGEFAGTLGEGGGATYLGKPDGSFELLGVGSVGTERVVHGRFISAGAGHIIFTTGDTEWCFVQCPIAQLEPNAPPTGTAAIYDRSVNGPNRVVSLLPGGVTPAAGEDAEYQGTSADGALVAFKIGGVLYVRADNTITHEITEEPAVYAGIRGRRIFYVSEGNIHDLLISSGEDLQVTTTGDAEVVNISADGTHVYFISPTALPGTDAQAGQPNLYLWTEADRQAEFIATVSPADLEGKPALNTWTSDVVTPEKTTGQGPGGNSSRTTPGGEIFVFESRAQLSGYENEGHVEIYRFDARSAGLACVSCNPSGAPATANARLEALEQFAVQQGGESMVIHNLSTDGGRVFFETTESLLPRDVDGVNDIYEWQAVGGEGATLALISSGNSFFSSNPTVPLRFQEPNVMFAVTPSGNDVIFRTSDQLLPGVGESGSIALYDARVGGGFAQPLPPACSSQVCEGPSSDAVLATPKSNAFRGRGNVRPRRHQRCHRARRGGKAAKRRSCWRHHGQRHHGHKKGAAK
jgi:hypothetical protein